MSLLEVILKSPKSSHEEKIATIMKSQKKAKYFLEIPDNIHSYTQKWRNRSSISTYTTHFWLHEKIPKTLSAESGNKCCNK